MAERFVELDVTSEQEWQELIADNDDQMHTKRLIRTSLSIFRAYLNEKGLEQNIEETYSSAELDSVLKNFYLEMKKSDGQYYAERSVRAIRYGLQKHFKKLRNEDIIHNVKYSSSNAMLKAVLRKMRKEVGRPQQKVSIHPNDVKKLYDTVFSINSPKGLQKKTIFEYIYYFCNRGREYLRAVQKEDFTFSIDSSGREYVTVRERNVKNQKQEELGETTRKSARMYDRPGDPMCPVTSFKKYLTKLNPINPYFWQRPKKYFSQSDEVWYENSPVGKNTLCALMMNLSVEANLSRRYNNSSIRATSITTIERQRIGAAISGYKNDESVKEYSSIFTDKKNQEMSDILCTNFPPKSVRNETAAMSLYDQTHPDSCVDCNCEARSPIRNEYRNILIGDAASAWKKLIGRFYWLHDSDIAKHLIEVHELYCTRGMCPLEKTRDKQKTGSTCRRRKLDMIPSTNSIEEKEDISLQLEVDDGADSIDDDSSDDGDLDMDSEEEVEIKQEPYSMDNTPPNSGSTHQDRLIPTTTNKSVNSGGGNLSHTPAVKHEPVEGYSDSVKIIVTNKSDSSFKLASSGAIIPAVTTDLAVRGSCTSSKIHEIPSPHFPDTAVSSIVRGPQTVNTKTSSVNVAQTSLLSTLKPLVRTRPTLNSATTETNPVQRILPLVLNSARGITVAPQNGLFSTVQRGSAMHVQRANTPSSVVVRPHNALLFRPVTLKLSTAKRPSFPTTGSFRVVPNVGQPVYASPDSGVRLIMGGEQASSGVVSQSGLKQKDNGDIQNEKGLGKTEEKQAEEILTIRGSVKRTLSENDDGPGTSKRLVMVKEEDKVEKDQSNNPGENYNQVSHPPRMSLTHIH